MSGTMRSRVAFDSMSSLSCESAVDALSFAFCCSGVSKISGTVIVFSTMASRAGVDVLHADAGHVIGRAEEAVDDDGDLVGLVMSPG